jgi:hypothetical protein
VGVAASHADLATRVRDTRRGAVLRTQSRAVNDLDAVHPRHEGSYVRCRYASIDARSDMVERREDPLLLQVRQELTHIVPKTLNLTVLSF